MSCLISRSIQHVVVCVKVLFLCKFCFFSGPSKFDLSDIFSVFSRKICHRGFVHSAVCVKLSHGSQSRIRRGIRHVKGSGVLVVSL